jgi:hypothetical protein
MKHIVVTSVNPPNKATREIAKGAMLNGWEFIVIGDGKSPAGYDLAGARFYSLADQRALPFDYARLCPVGHYARKNIGYLIAMNEAADEILETDDDNIPYNEFFLPREGSQSARVSERSGWLNIYQYFSDSVIWPRGLPLNEARATVPSIDVLPQRTAMYPVHQGLADENPDVDAVYRLLFPLPIKFKSGPAVAISGESSCPFNSQNTRWWPEAYPLLYLPFFCSFRMTDIWRSFVAQCILAARGSGVLFHHSTVYQERNEHDLMRDFRDEVDGYLKNSEIMAALRSIPLSSKKEAVYENLALCYEKLIEIGVVGKDERELLAAWSSDCQRVSSKSRE